MKLYTVITGASSGIGKEAAKIFAAHGKNLVLVARRQERLKQLKEEIQRRFPEIDVMLHCLQMLQCPPVMTSEITTYSPQPAPRMLPIRD